MTASTTTFDNKATILSGLSGVPGTEQRFYHSDTESIYALPTDSDEFDRLEKQHQLMLYLFNGPISVESIKRRLEENHEEPIKILDVGCGPGSWTKQVSKQFPNALVYATDFVESFQPNDDDKVKFTQGNVLTGLPFQDETFDLVHMRFFTGALKKQEWKQATSELFRVTKKNGWVQMVEPDGQLRCLLESDILQDWNLRGMRGSLKKRGGDPEAGIHLDRFLSSVGFESIQTFIRSAPMSKRFPNDHLGSLMQHDYLSLITTLAPVLCQSWDLTPEQMIEWGHKVMKECTRLEAFHNFVTAIGQRPVS